MTKQYARRLADGFLMMSLAGDDFGEETIEAEFEKAGEKINTHFCPNCGNKSHTKKCSSCGFKPSF